MFSILLEGKNPDDHHQRQYRDRQQQVVREVEEEAQGEGDAADLGGQGQQAEQLGGDQGHCADPEAEALAHDVHHRPLGHRCHTAAHLGVEGDADHSDDDRPEDLEAERRPRLGHEDEVADVDEAADRGEDPERDLEVLAHSPSLSWSALSETSLSFSET